MCTFVVVATIKWHRNNNNKENNNNSQNIQVLITEQKMYVRWSFCSCSFSCVILLLLQQQHCTVTTTAITKTKTSLYINVLIKSRTHIYSITHLTSWQHDANDNHMSMTLCSTTLGHQMPVLGDTSDLGMPDCKCQADLTSDCTCQPHLM